MVFVADLKRLLLICFTVHVSTVHATRWTGFDSDWKFHRGDGPSVQPSDCRFPQDLNSTQCLGLTHTGASTTDACAAACCGSATCETWQFCPVGAKGCDGEEGCWIGQLQNCHVSNNGWISRARNVSPNPITKCETPFCMSNFDDSAWVNTETPHDWANDDLPTREDDTVLPVFEVRNGTWLFSKTDNADQSKKSFDDSDWTSVQVPHDWRQAPTNMGANDKVGWYRRHLPAATAAHMAASSAGTLNIALGTVLGSATVYINGVQVGTTGDGGCGDEIKYRTFGVPANTLSNSSTNVVAIRVGAGDFEKPGGLYDSMAPDMRSGPFDPGASPGQKQTGYTVAGVGWYRKHFQAVINDVTMIRFDGIYMHADVYVNEIFLGTHPYGYTTFEYDVTHALNKQGPNVLAIRVASMGSNSRWYAGAGIFRHVWITTIPFVHAHTFGGIQAVAKQASIDIAKKTAELDFSFWLLNDGTKDATADLTFQVVDPEGKAVAPVTTIPNIQMKAGQGTNLTSHMGLSNIHFWSVDQPSLYSVMVNVTSGNGGSLDWNKIEFGVRKISFDSANGFMLNGKMMNLKGGCVHHDNGPLGSKTISRSEERRVQILKDNGYNAIRTSHNPVSPAFVEACDKLGMLLMEEAFDCWDGGKNGDDYHLYFDEWWQRDVTSMVLRDINSPSIIMWSIGNEIPIRRTPKGIALSATLSDFIRNLDPKAGNGRGITAAYPGPTLDNTTDAYMAPLDVAGYNYGWSQYEKAHARVPSRVIAGTESFPMQSSQTWTGVTNNSHVIGDFIWTAIDYIGESAIGGTGFNTPDMRACGGYCPQGWSWHISFCGDIDIVGFRKPQSFYRNVLWGVSELEIAVHEPVPVGQHEVVASWGWPSEFPSWNWNVADGFNMSVNVYSTYPLVELLVNNKSVTPNPVSTNANQQLHTATIPNVPFAAGSITAVGYDKTGQEMGRKTITTTMPAAGLLLTPDRAHIKASRDDLSYVTCEVVDRNGLRVPDASVVVSFTVHGDGELAAVGTGDPADASSFHSNSRMTYHGRAMAILRPGSKSTAPKQGGTIVITASAPGLTPTSVTVSSDTMV